MTNFLGDIKVITLIILLIFINIVLEINNTHITVINCEIILSIVGDTTYIFEDLKSIRYKHVF